MSLTAASGTYTTAGAPAGFTHALASLAPSHIVITIQLYRHTEPRCVKTDLACTVRTRVLLTSGSGVNNAPSPGTGDTARLNFNSNPGGVVVTVTGGSCPATISSQLVGQHASGTLNLSF